MADVMLVGSIPHNSTHEAMEMFGRPLGPQAYAGMPSGRARRMLTDEVMDAIAALSGQERVDAYNELPPGSTGAAVGI